ncbi:MAG: hypothetical protein Q9167_000859 [Letrouitia subvulpina]
MVQSKNIYPQLLLGRLFFSLGGSACSTMVSAVLPALFSPSTYNQTIQYGDAAGGAIATQTNEGENAAAMSSGISAHQQSANPSAESGAHRSTGFMRQPREHVLTLWKSATKGSSPTRLAGLVGLLTGCGALLALVVFLPLPARLQRSGIRPADSVADTYYIVGASSLAVSLLCFIGLRNLQSEKEKSARSLLITRHRQKDHLRSRMAEPIKAAFTHPLLGLAYLGSLVARASSVGISLFIPLFVNTKFSSSARSNTALLLAAVAGIVGYLGFSLIDNPEPSGSSKPLLFATVVLQGISQIGAIVCSLGLLGRTVLDPNPTRNSDHRTLKTRSSGSEATENLRASLQDRQEAEILHVEPSDSTNENTSLLPDQMATPSNLAHHKGSIAGVYSLCGGIGILVLTKAGEREHEAKVAIARRTREAIIKVAPVGGLPKSINALLALKQATPSALLDGYSDSSPTSRAAELYDVPSSRILERGKSFFDQVYGQMDHSGTEDLGITARIMYGYVLSNMNVLNAAETSFVLLAGLIPQDVNPQVKGHLKGAMNNGASLEEVRAVRQLIVRICEAYGMRINPSNGWGWKGEIANL